MSEFFTLISPDEARARILAHVKPLGDVEAVPTVEAIGRVLAEDVRSPQILPEFRRSTVDGYAVRAADTHGASDTLPAYLKLGGEVPMGQVASFEIGVGELAVVHTGGNVPPGADAVVMIEDTNRTGEDEVEVRKPVAEGENVIQPGEDIDEGELILPAGHRLREQDIGGLMAVGCTEVKVARRPRVYVFATGDEVIPPHEATKPGQVRDINSYTVAALAEQAGAAVTRGGILPDDFDTILARTREAIEAGADMIVLSAGSSVSVRDMTAEVFNQLGEPGVLVHGIATKPGKPTILGVGNGIPLIGLPGNPVSAFVQFLMVCTPVIYRLQGAEVPPTRFVRVPLAVNVPSTAGREDYVPTRLVERDGQLVADPIFFKSNLIFTLVHADGLLRVPLNATGLEAGEMVEVRVF
ncbi:MAG: molybdopterin molybdenumtransferase MoeA [Chloroflexi bacterium]|nr:molybdopterin molybdenumtransferase MoeA [Chloroflexota bacterium]